MDDVLVDEALSVHYGQFYVSEAGKGNAEFEAAFRGQANGLLGAAVARFLHITTGLHTGHVWITVSLHVDAPPRDPASEDEVEATTEQIAKIDAALKADGCEGGDIDVGKDGSFEVDDVKCKDGQYDVKLDKDFKIMGKKKE